MQLGPRIRIGGSVGKFGDKAKKVAQKGLSNPWVQGGLGLLTGGATIPLLAGAVGGGLKEHAGVKDVVKGGAQGFAAGSAGKGVRNIGQGLLNRVGSQGASNAATSTGGMGGGAGGSSAPGILSPSQIQAGGEIAKSANFPAASAGGELAGLAGGDIAGSRSILQKAGSALGDVGGFVQKNPTAVGMGLQGLGSLASAGSENRMNDAQAELLEQRADETAYDFEQRKRREAALEGLWSPLGSAIGSSYAGIAANPYAPVS